MITDHLYPQRVFYYFEQIAAIPHGSRNTKAISDYLVEFAKEHQLVWYQDESNNVVIVKEATNPQNRLLFRDIWIWSVRKRRVLPSILRKMD